MALHTNTSATFLPISDVSVGSRPLITLHASILNLLGFSGAISFEHRRGAFLPKPLATSHNYKFLTSMTGVNTSENTLYFFTQRFPIFFQHNAFLSNFKKLHLLNKLRTIGEQGVAEVRQELAQFAQGKTEG